MQNPDITQEGVRLDSTDKPISSLSANTEELCGERHPIDFRFKLGKCTKSLRMWRISSAERRQPHAVYFTLFMMQPSYYTIALIHHYPPPLHRRQQRLLLRKIATILLNLPGHKCKRNNTIFQFPPALGIYYCYYFSSSEKKRLVGLMAWSSFGRAQHQLT